MAKKQLLSVEIYNGKGFEDIDKFEEFKKKFPNTRDIKSKFLLIQDLSKPYIIKVTTTTKEYIDIIDPEEIPIEDQFELNESIVNFLKEIGIKAKPMVSEKDLDKEINQESIKKFKEIAAEMIKSKKKINDAKNISADIKEP